MNRLLHYEISQKIGRGGGGEVYAAVDTRLGRKVAVKILPPEFSGDPLRKVRFEREARAIAALNHPNIVTIHSVEESDGSMFLVMELIEGKALSQLIPPDGLPLEKFFDLAGPIADAISAAHQQGVTHRDLKPANIMVANDGRVKVLDFGLAKLMESKSGGEQVSKLQTSPMTGHGMIVGTVDYMSPEQAQGKPVDSRSDIFSLGIMFHEMATGERPFKGDTPIATISSILSDQPPSISQLRSSLPRHLGRIVSRCLAKDPNRRYQNASDLRNDLLGLKEEIDSGELLAPAAGPHSGGSRAFRGLAWLVMAILTVVLGYLVFSYLGRRSSGSDVTNPFQEMKITRLSSTGNTFRAAVSPNGRYVVEVVRQGGLHSLRLRQLRSAGAVDIVPPAETVLAEPVFSPDGESIYFMGVDPGGAVASTIFRVPLLGGSPQRVLGEALSAISFSPDRRQLAVLRLDAATGQTSLVVSDVDGANQRVLAVRTPPDRFVSNPAWAPDGRGIAVATTGETQASTTVVEVPLNGGEERVLSPRRWASITEVAWLPGGESLVFAGRDGLGPSQLWELNSSDGRVRRITNDLASYQSVSLTADGKALVTVVSERIYHLWVGSIDGTTPPRQLTFGAARDDNWGISWTPDGRIVWGARSLGGVALWMTDVDGGKMTQLTQDSGHVSAGPSVSPDGRYVVFHSNRADESFNLWRLSLNSGDLTQLTFGGSETGALCAPDGESVIYLDHRSRGLFRLPLQGGSPELISRRYFYTTPDVSPDGKKLAITVVREGIRNTGVEIVSLDGQILQEFDIPLQYSPRVLWTRDGAALTFIDNRGAGDNIWLLPLDGGPSRALTRFETGSIGDFAWSPDGARIALSRGRTTSDIALLEDFR